MRDPWVVAGDPWQVTHGTGVSPVRLWDTPITGGTPVPHDHSY